MTLDEGLLVLGTIYLIFLMLGCCFYYTTAKLNSVQWRLGNNALKIFRFFMYVVLLPVSLTCFTALYLVYAEYISFL